MLVANICKSYFNVRQEISDYQENSYLVNARSAMLLLTYFTVVIPLAMGTMYGACSLYERATAEARLPEQIKAAQVAQKKWLAKKIDLNDVFGTYKENFKPQINQKNLRDYSRSPVCQRHSKTARVYYNRTQLTDKDALRVVLQREPTNIGMGSYQYFPKALERIFGYRKGVYNDPKAKKADGTSFADLPNSVTVYSETYLWSPAGGKNKKEVAILSVPAPALDSPKQPNYKYYMVDGQLNAKKYLKEMGFLFRAIEQAIRDNRKTAFEGRGIKRVVLSKFGLGAFLAALSSKDKVKVINAFKTQAALFRERIADLDLEIVLSSGDVKDCVWDGNTLQGDILKASRNYDLIINPWDPHSAPGNGNDGDNSFDGALGMGTGILVTQTSWINRTLRRKSCLRPVGPSAG